MPEKHRRNFLKDKEARSLLNQINERFKVDFVQSLGSRARVELIETEFAQIYCINKKPLFAKMEAELFPTLMADELFVSIAKVVVDMGAIPYVCKGANVMMELGVLMVTSRRVILFWWWMRSIVSRWLWARYSMTRVRLKALRKELL